MFFCFPIQHGIRLPYPYSPLLVEQHGRLYLGIELRHNGCERINWEEARSVLRSCHERYCEHDPRTARQLAGTGILLRQMRAPYLRQWLPTEPP